MISASMFMRKIVYQVQFLTFEFGSVNYFRTETEQD